jgi:hypothetical protein
MRAGLFQREFPFEGNAVPDEVEIAIREIDDAPAVDLDPRLGRDPLLGNGPVEAARAGRHLCDAERGDLAQNTQRLSGRRT